MIIDNFLRGYVTAALWSSIDDNDEPMDANYSQTDIDPGTRAAMRADCERFYTTHSALCDHALRLYADQAMEPGTTAEDALGHDLWLTRNGHGTGWWDRDCLESCNVGNQLDALVGYGTAFPPVDLYITEDGRVTA